MHAERDEPRPIPEPEDTGDKEVFAFFGLCSYCAQVLEQGVVNWAVGLRAYGLTDLTGPAVSAAFDQADRRTLGQLLHDVRRRVEIRDDTEVRLGQALEDRNFLFHRFFVKHDVDFGSNSGRQEMIDELRAMTRRFQETDLRVTAVSIPLWETLGLTRELREAEIERMRDEARQKDGSV